MDAISIDIENVTVAYHGKVALHSASLQLKAGTICGLVGMNGAVATFCDQVVLINRSILAYGDTSEVFTEENLSRTFGGSVGDFSFTKSRFTQSNQEEQ
ncbi:hypothetical protein [Leptodesmis sp.]|uniref:hypothetical protein n=1 Tax=Leptodesmis sp. TaxID=3100501 RepID=UPI0040534B9D